MAKLRKVKLVRYDESRNLWSCTYWSFRNGKNILVRGYVKASKELKEESFIKAEKLRKISFRADGAEAENASGLTQYQLFAFMREA